MIDALGNIYINGELLSESYGKEAIKDPGMAANSIYLGSDEYFVLGDNRNNSSDSRDPSVGTDQAGSESLAGHGFAFFHLIRSDLCGASGKISSQRDSSYGQNR